MPVDYEEIGAPTINQDSRTGKWTGKRTLKCAYADRIALMAEFLTPYPGVGHPENEFAYATGAAVLPFGKTVDSGDPDVIAWTYAKVTISYATPGTGDPIAQPDGSVISESIEASAEFLTLDHSRFRWDSGTGPVLKAAEAPGRMNLGFDYPFARYNVTSIPIAAMQLIGQCNESQMSSSYLGLTFGPESILYTALTLNHRADAVGHKIDYTMRFSYRNNWNEFWRLDKPGGAGYSKIYLEGGTEYKNYPLGNLTLL